MPTCGYCRDCKWWEIHSIYTRETAIGGNCALAEQDSDENANSLATAHDTEQYHAWLSTSPEFGCVQFQPVE